MARRGKYASHGISVPPNYRRIRWGSNVRLVEWAILNFEKLSEVRRRI